MDIVKRAPFQWYNDLVDGGEIAYVTVSKHYDDLPAASLCSLYPPRRSATAHLQKTTAEPKSLQHHVGP